MSRLVFSLAVILSGMTAGYVVQILSREGLITLPLPLAELRKLLQKLGLLFFMPVAFTSAIWVIEVRDMRIAALPALGVAALLLGGAAAMIAARTMNLTRKQTGAFVPCGSFTNLGGIGGLVVFLFCGEEGFALVPLYKLFEGIVYFTTGFPLARAYATEPGKREPFEGIKKVFTDVFLLTALTSVAVGGALNAAGVPRPEFFSGVTAVFIPIGTFVILTSIGMAMRFTSVRDYLKESLVVAGIKFIVIPVIICTAALLLGYGTIDNGLPLRVVIILSSMPVAFVALVPPSIYDLDVDLANACWLTTTLGLVVVLPVLRVLTLGV